MEQIVLDVTTTDDAELAADERAAEALADIFLEDHERGEGLLWLESDVARHQDEGGRGVNLRVLGLYYRQLRDQLGDHVFASLLAAAVESRGEPPAFN